MSDLGPDSARWEVWDTGTELGWDRLWRMWSSGCATLEYLNQLGVGLSAVAAVAAVWRRRGLWEAGVGRMMGHGSV